MGMRIAVFDTWVQRDDGRRMHFDILVRDEPAHRGMEQVLAHGQRYLAAKGLPQAILTAQECRFCHIESAPPAVADEVDQTGFAIIELQNCDAA